MTIWTNWSGMQKARPDRVVSIQDENQLADLLRDSDGPIRAIGSGHSFSPLAVTYGTMLQLDGITGVQPVPGRNDAVQVGAGMVLRDMTAAMHDMGHALANMGDVDGQRLGGALATATHGTGAAFPCYSGMLDALRLIDTQGQAHDLTRASDEALFRAMAVSLGTGGIVTQATLHTVTPYRLARRRFVIGLGDLLDDFDARMTSARNTEFYYIPHSGMALGLESLASDMALVARPRDRDETGLRQLRMMARMMGWTPRFRNWLTGVLLRSHAEERFTEDWHRAYPTSRDGMRFNESEWHVPVEVGAEVLTEVVRVIETSFPNIYFPMEIRTVAADDLFLSPFYGRESVSIAVHHEAGQDFQPLLDAIQPIFLAYDGRPHWGKLHNLTAGDLRSLYPHWDTAIEARRHLDPQGKLLTPYMRRLLGL
ncbi:MAG: D-arabinono-1,4-lactone oxidase [Paracoccus sp. (in: a-proteobacteria)]|uniref:D-arabinono-1,4-lactone oxidase n=1 Tax=Paracoccus sp. TaxID=267 RepID=UPI0026E00368|nr:D-arabinono-1,4-lactone oxidase [Paracoccus sp. (in: a-proteobacteria)]MDO5622849.1 D-arabinono-1,4-lactone oxidase [Paracoccus sp. (in: a-proteobacteria)]